jgi:hypothetical protein
MKKIIKYLIIIIFLLILILAYIWWHYYNKNKDIDPAAIAIKYLKIDESKICSQSSIIYSMQKDINIYTVHISSRNSDDLCWEVKTLYVNGKDWKVINTQDNFINIMAKDSWISSEIINKELNNASLWEWRAYYGTPIKEIRSNKNVVFYDFTYNENTYTYKLNLKNWDILEKYIEKNIWKENAMKMALWYIENKYNVKLEIEDISASLYLPKLVTIYVQSRWDTNDWLANIQAPVYVFIYNLPDWSSGARFVDLAWNDTDFVPELWTLITLWDYYVN